MANDPAIDEIRRVRHEISEELGHDHKKIIEHFAKLQSAWKGPIIDSPEKLRSNKAPVISVDIPNVAPQQTDSPA